MVFGKPRLALCRNRTDARQAQHLWAQRCKAGSAEPPRAGPLPTRTTCRRGRLRRQRGAQLDLFGRGGSGFLFFGYIRDRDQRDGPSHLLKAPNHCNESLSTMSLVTDLLAGVAAFFADVWVFRRQRQKRGHASRGIADDAIAVAHFDFVTAVWIALVSVGLTLLLVLGFGVPVAWGVGIGVVVAAVWGYRKYAQLLREPQ